MAPLVDYSPISPVSPATAFSKTLDDVSLLTKAGVKHSLVESKSPLAELSASKLTITLTSNPRTVPAPDSAAANNQTTASDHMLSCRWNAETGWETPEIKPYGDLSISPIASVLHYATECFEGMKVYRGYDGKVRLFRPELNARRFLKSARRIALPSFDPNEFLKLLDRFIAVDAPKWLPDGPDGRGRFLYLRPTMIGTQAALGPQRPAEALLYVVAVMFPSVDEPRPASNGVAGNTGKIRLLASRHDMIRAWPGGFGNAKLGANYGPSLVAQAEAKSRGYGQILWLFGEECYVTEAGASNFFVLWQNKAGKLELITAPLGDGIILEGVTRQSILDIVRRRCDAEIEVVERKVTMFEIAAAHREGRLKEAFVCGTAYFVVPVTDIHFRGIDIEFPAAKGSNADFSAKVKGWLKDIMYGKIEHEWGRVIGEA